MERFEELEDVLYGPNELDATVLSTSFDGKGSPVEYTIELHEGYSDPNKKVIFADPASLKKVKPVR